MGGPANLIDFDLNSSRYLTIALPANLRRLTRIRPIRSGVPASSG